MFNFGELQKLKVAKKVDFGIYLTEGTQEVLLPSRQVPPDIKIGDELEVFLYRDSKDRPISTTARPLIMLHQVRALKVKELGKIGAFLDWGLEKDLLLPFREQTGNIAAGDVIPVALYLDKSSRLCATMKIYKFLSTEAPYRKDDRVTGTVYEISSNFGVFVAVDNIYSALLPPRELCRELKVGETVSCRVTGVKEDGKLDLSLREKGYIQMSIDAAKIMEELKKRGGELPFTDKASPEVIRENMNMSKSEFKRAVGNLLKAGKIAIGGTTIYVLKEEKDED